ncbi:MAG TPA: hypothetical protein VGO48_09955 [Conexibacter sp.]|nr:hypothetical protein [Conexibacter sp.]
MRGFAHNVARWLLAGTLTAFAALCLTAATAPAAPPDGRAYELVSPPQKNGGDVRIETSKIRVSDDGRAASFTSYVPFGDVAGTSIEVTYLSRRDGVGRNGWDTHAISPQQDPLTLQAVTGNSISDFEPTFTSDLSSGVYRSWRPLTSAPNVETTSNLFLLGGLRTGTPTVPLLLSDAVSPIPVASTFGSYRPVTAGASDDLSHVIFESKAPLTAPNPPPNRTRLYESVNGSVRLAGILPDGAPAASSQAGFATFNNFYPAPHSISADGSHVFFTNPLTGLIYVRIDGATTVQLNTSENTAAESPGRAIFDGASADGTRAFFTTSEGLVDGDDDGLTDLYMYDETAPVGARLMVLSTDGEPGDGDASVSRVVGASEDGQYVYFTADGQLAAGEPLGISDGLFLWHDGAVAYIGHLLDSTDSAVNSLSTRFSFVIEQRTARVTPDGRHLLFMTRGDVGLRDRGGFAGYDHGSGCTFDGIPGPCRELYVYSADSGRLACASCNPMGAPATTDAFDNIRQGVGIATWHADRALSDDGSRVFFTTREALVPQDVNEKLDAYEYDVPSGQVHLLSSGTSSSDSYFAEASPSGDDALIVTRERLVGWDVDSNYDLYDVKVHGGFPDPPPLTPSCGGEACQGQPGHIPAQGAAASAVFRGAGDLRQALKRSHRTVHRRCARHAARPRRHRKGRCVRKAARARGERVHSHGERRGK